ncbi:MAG: hypothetical protein ACREC8_05875, partial [Limisphaerales bacterium]
MAGANANGRIAHIVGRHKYMARIIDLVARVALQFISGGEHRRFARAELFAAHLVRFEIVSDMFAEPDFGALL